MPAVPAVQLVPDAATRAELTITPGVIAISGPFDTAAAARLWPGVTQAAQAARGKPLVIDLSAAVDVTTAGAALLVAAMARHGDASLRGDTPVLADMVAQIQAAPPPPRPAYRPWTYLGAARFMLAWARAGIEFMGEGLVAAVTLGRRRRQIRITDLMRLIDESGVRAIPLVLLLGYLIGLILAFQSSIPLRRFGADIFVVNLVSLSLVRELGPLLSAVILSGRTGSAFAAELGTMKVNEELAALETMGISTTTMLVLPRMAAAVLVMPVMTLLLDLAGLCGMVTVMMAFGFPLTAVTTQLLRAVHGGDLWGGLFKAVCFGAAVAAIGCRAGLSTGVGPRAVGQSATAAVVGGIVATVIMDGLFAVAFYRLGL
jgi:phospholipid/cholesterol/gamma-HCH transport system permease protein